MVKMADMYAALEQDADLMTVGGRIEHLRRSLQMSQEDLAKALPKARKGGRSRATIALYESGKPVSLQTISELAPILGVDPSYLAFGVVPHAGAAVPQGQRIPVHRDGFHAKEIQHAFLPSLMASELNVVTKTLKFARLAIDAPAFGIRAGDYLLLDTSSCTIDPDGHLYAVQTSAGVTLVRSEPIYRRDADSSICFISGQGARYSYPSSSLEVTGQLVAALQRHT